MRFDTPLILPPQYGCRLDSHGHMTRPGKPTECESCGMFTYVPHN